MWEDGVFGPATSAGLDLALGLALGARASPGRRSLGAPSRVPSAHAVYEAALAIVPLFRNTVTI
jgi:hypothetical protein